MHVCVGCGCIHGMHWTHMWCVRVRVCSWLDAGRLWRDDASMINQDQF